MNVASLLEKQAAVQPDAAAIIETINGQDRTTTFSRLNNAVESVSASLCNNGLKEGDTVLVFYPMTGELYATLIALFRLGCAAMFVDPSAGADHISGCCDIAQPQAFIASPKAHLLRLKVRALRKIPLKMVIGGLPFVPRLDPWRETENSKPVVDCENETPALITFTSGSTGRPKAIVRSHGFMRVQLQVLQKALNIQPGQTHLTTLPIFLLANLACGAVSLIPNCDLRRPGFVVPEPIIRQIRQRQPNSVGASPAFLECLMEGCARMKVDLPSFETVFTGGAPVFPNLLESLSKRCPNAVIYPVYGSTEAEPIAEIPFSEISSRDKERMIRGEGLLAGQPVPEIELRILRHQWGEAVGPYTVDEFNAQCLPPDQPGEIVVHGEHVVKGYLGRIGDEETKFEAAGSVWHRTGDAGYLDALGRLWLLGRCSARIEDEKGVLYPFSVEVAAMSFSGVTRSALVQQDGLRILVLELKAGSRESILNPLRESLAEAGIGEFRVLESIPVDKRHNAKIDYPALKRIL